MTFIDFCSGIGGFRYGFEKAGHECIGYAEKDKFALLAYRAMYETSKEWFFEDIEQLTPDAIPYADIWAFGFPCQDISAAGKRTGITGARSGLYFKIIDLIKGKSYKDRPKLIIIENVNGLLWINNGWDFFAVLSEMGITGYNAEWKVYNSADFGIPQIRKRVYIAGFLRGYAGEKILPEPRADDTFIRHIIGGNTQSSSLEIYPCISPNRDKVRQNGRRAKGNGEPSFTLTIGDRHGIIIRDVENGDIAARQLTPKEYWRLQGFPDELFEKAKSTGLSDVQLYKLAGNAVTTAVTYEIGKNIK